MIIDLRLPNITGATEKEQLLQIKSYLSQLIPQLNFALANVGQVGSSSEPNIVKQSVVAAPSEQMNAEATFNSIKSLIIKSAEIVNAYYDEISKKLEGVYVAESDFGTFVEESSAEIEANSQSITQNYEHHQQLITEISTTVKRIDTSAYIQSGLLDFDKDGVPIYGIEIGQRAKSDDENLSQRYARFTSGRLEFYCEHDQDNPVAYISDYWLEITNAKILGTFSMGGFAEKALPNGDVVIQWIQGGEG